MGHVFFRLRQREAAVTHRPLRGLRILIVAVGMAVAFSLHTGMARASTCTVPPQNCTQSPIVTQAQGTISQTPATAVTTWDGQLYAIGETTDPSLCLPNTADPGNALCDHFELTPQDPGPVRVTVTWPDSFNTFQLLVCLNTVVDTTNDDCTGGTLIAEDLDFGNNAFASVVFTPTPGTTYDVRVIPFSVFASDYSGCAGYTNANACTPPNAATGGVVSSTTCATTNDLGITNTLADRKITGGADIADSSGNMKEHLSLNASQTQNGTQFKGMVNYKNDGVLRFKSTSISCVTFFDEGTDANGHPKGSAEIRGTGKLRFDSGQENDNECFRAFARDQGEPGSTSGGATPATADQWDFEFTDPTTDSSGKQVCSFNGAPVGRPINQGNIDYHINS
jgi:hypothetical protein